VFAHRFSKLLAASTLVLIAAGGLVTSTDSGLSVPDWPLSYGQLFPPMVGGIRFEHTHRVIAGIVGILTLILTLILIKKETRRWVKIFGVAAFLGVIVQAVLGGITVIYLLPTAVSVLHACLAQTFFCLVLCLALFTSREWKEALPVFSETAGSLKRLLLATTCFIYVQLVLGALVRHAEGFAVAYHIALAFLILLHILFILFKFMGSEITRQVFFPHAALLALAATLQIFLGFGAYIMTLVLPKAPAPRFYEIILTAAHQSAGALVLGLCVLLTLRSFRLLKQV
jgi:cytochrome c oxidase assembly protein subunit 15